jgi:hypothetical protein
MSGIHVHELLLFERNSFIPLDYLQPSFSISFIYRILYKILSSISHFSPTTFSKSCSLYIKPYIRNVFCFKFLYVRIYHISNAIDIFYFYLIQCLKRKEKIEKRRENLYIQRKPVAFSILEDHLENAAGAIENEIFSIYRVENGSESTVGDSLRPTVHGKIACHQFLDARRHTLPIKVGTVRTITTDRS